MTDPARARNAGMTQLTWRIPADDEPLSLTSLYGLNLWTDGDGELVVVDVPPGFKQGVVQ